MARKRHLSILALAVPLSLTNIDCDSALASTVLRDYSFVSPSFSAQSVAAEAAAAAAAAAAGDGKLAVAIVTATMAIRILVTTIVEFRRYVQ